MATVPGQLVWEIVKKNNSFLVKEFGNGTAGVTFSKEPNNLYNLHSYKHSGWSSSSSFSLLFFTNLNFIYLDAFVRFCCDLVCCHPFLEHII